MDSTSRLEMIAGIALLVLLVLGSILVLRPFLASLILSAILAYASWPVYEWLLRRLRGSQATPFAGSSGQFTETRNLTDAQKEGALALVAAG